MVLGTDEVFNGRRICQQQLHPSNDVVVIDNILLILWTFVGKQKKKTNLKCLVKHKLTVYGSFGVNQQNCMESCCTA